MSARALEEAGGSGTLGAGAFSGVIAALLAEGAPAGDRSYVAHYTSFDVLRSHKHKEVRPEKGPEETLRVPATQLQTVGWSARDAKPDVRHPKVRSKGCCFADSQVGGGLSRCSPVRTGLLSRDQVCREPHSIWGLLYLSKWMPCPAVHERERAQERGAPCVDSRVHSDSLIQDSHGTQDAHRLTISDSKSKTTHHQGSNCVCSCIPRWWDHPTPPGCILAVKHAAG